MSPRSIAILVAKTRRNGNHTELGTPKNGYKNLGTIYNVAHFSLIDKAFEDTWSWGTESQMAYHELLVNVNGQIGDTIAGLRKFLNETPMFDLELLYEYPCYAKYTLLR